MRAAGRPTAHSTDCCPETQTLGDVLFADGRDVPTESEWVVLVRSIAARDENALRALYQRTEHLVFTLIMRITQDPQTAEEVTLDVFHDVWRRASAYDATNGSVVGWVMNQARSRAIDRVRFDRRKKRLGSGAPDATGETGAGGPLAAAALREQERLLRTALSALTPDERRAIETAFFSGMTHVETATHLGLPVGTVKTHIRAGLSKLRRLMGGMPP